MTDLDATEVKAVGQATTLIALWSEGEFDAASEMLIDLSREDADVVTAYLLTLVVVLVDDAAIRSLALRAQAEVS